MDKHAEGNSQQEKQTMKFEVGVDKYNNLRASLPEPPSIRPDNISIVDWQVFLWVHDGHTYDETARAFGCSRCKVWRATHTVANALRQIEAATCGTSHDNRPYPNDAH
jgi:hypothetical protein